MSDTITSPRVEPIMDPGPAPAPIAAHPTSYVQEPPRPAPPDVPPSYGAPAATAAPAAPDPSGMSSPADQLARLEDKTARIEEKLARSEAATQRVVDRFEAASHRMNEVAQQSDLAAVRGDVKWISRRVKALPGFAAIILASVITAVLTAVLTVVIFRYLPGTLVR